MSKLSHLLLAFITSLAACLTASANNIQVDNISLTGQDQTQGFVQVKFDVQWENSWRISGGPNNWDAAWLFIKFRKAGEDWSHAQLLSGGGVAPMGSALDVTSDGVGAFLYRDAPGSGTSDFDEVELRWNYAAAGIDVMTTVDVQVFALEMVYAPQGAFDLGIPAQGGVVASEYGPFYDASTSLAYRISSEGAIDVNPSTGLFYNGGGDGNGPLPAAFPKGFAAIYAMKYETSQQQWVDFFNTLTTLQKKTNDITELISPPPNNYRNGVALSGSGDATTVLPNVAINQTSYADRLAYLDWAGLRPMTELEFEKLARGTRPSVAGQYVWGTDEIATSRYTITNEGTASEALSGLATNAGNAIYGSTFFDAARVGIFAASAPSPTREQTGGSYYGHMELGGNLREFTVSVGTSSARAYTGQEGDGMLAPDGLSNTTGWPSANSDFIERGGSWGSFAPALLISSRTDPKIDQPISGFLTGGFRGIRSAQ